jgi:hypothetical protein
VKAFLLTVAGCLGLLAIVPLMVWGCSGSWRRALQALREYLQAMGILVALGGGTALLMMLGDFIGR